jgi:hypothetical protein
MKKLWVVVVVSLMAMQGCSSLSTPDALVDGGASADAGSGVDAGSPSDGGSTDAVAPMCSPDPERLNGVHRCQVDEQCPCGAHCALGRCIYECLDGVQACADGERCSLFGRCVEGASEPAGSSFEEDIAPPDPAPMGRVRLKRRVFDLVDRDQLVALRLTIEEAPVAAVRFGDGTALRHLEGEEPESVEGRPQVNCDNSDESGFSDECLLRNLAVGSTHTVYVRTGDVEARATQWSVGVYGARQGDVVMMRLKEQGQILPEAAPVTGRYEGTLHLSDADGRSVMNLPVQAEVLEEGNSAKIKLIDALKILGPSGALWGRPVDDGYQFHWQRILGDEADELGDVEVHMGLHRAEGLRVSGAGWLGGRFDMKVAGWLPESAYLACANGQFMCGGDGHPCCGRNGVDSDLWSQAVTAATADLKLFRRGDLPDRAEVRSFDEHAEDSTTRFGDLRQRIWSDEARSPWDQVAQQIFQLDSANAVIDSRVRDWASLSDDSRSLLRCETDAVELGAYSCKGTAYQGGPGRNNPLCTDAVIQAMPNVCQTYQRRSCAGNDPQTCLHVCYTIDVGGDGPSPLTERSYRNRDIELARASLCAERYFCYEPPSGEGFDSESSALFQRVLPVSGDLTCARPQQHLQDQIPTALGLFTNADAAEEEQETLNAGAMLEACFRDLAREVPSLEGRGPIWDGADLRRVFQTQGCIDLARFWASLRWASAPAMFAAIDPSTRQSETMGDQSKANGMYLRLMTQWLQLHQFLAVEGLQAHKLAKVLRQGNDVISPTAVPSLGRIRQVLSGAWDVFLRPRIVTGLLGVSPEQLRNADYRRMVFPRLTPSARAYHEQRVGLPVFLVEAMNTYMEVLEAEGEEVWASGSDLTRHRDQMAQAVRQSILMESLADRVYRRANVGQGTWAPRYLQARTQLKGLRARVLRVMINMAGQGNPLGIEEDDLPLYFSVDQGGDIGRFSVISNYFLNARSGIATQAVEAASNNLVSARSAWLSLREGVLQDRNHVVEASARETATAQRYGDQILETCGAHRGWQRPNDPGNNTPVRSAEAVAWLDSIPDFGSCFLDTEEASCRLSPQLLYDAVQPEQLEYQLCKAAVYRYHYDDQVQFIDPDTQALAVATLDEWLALYTQDALTPERAVEILNQGVAGASTAARRGFFKGLKGAEHIATEHSTHAHDACLGVLPNAAPQLPSYGTLADGPLQNNSCYMGALGEATLEAMQTIKAMEAARASISERVEAYNIAVQSCHYGSQLGNAQEQLMRQHNSVMVQLRAARLAATLVAEVTSHSWLDHLESFGGKAVSAVAKTTAQGMSDAMERAQEQHALAMARYENVYGDLICFNDAKLHLVGLKTDKINLEAAVLGMDRAAQRARTMMARLDALREEGRVAIARVEGWQRPPVAHDRWLDEDVDGFLNAMRRAKRTAYLAVRAAEYEFQMSREERSAILQASHPGELEEALADLRTVVNTQRINGRSPENFRAIFSLKTHLMQLASRENFPETAYRFNGQQRFRALLNARRFAVHDSDGAYLGQRIPFKLTPFDLQNNSGEFSLPVISASRDCGERLWGVNVSLDGDNLVPEGASRQSARVELLQKNTFFSRWCSDSRDGYQVQTVRPERNLFRDPLAGSPQGAQEPRVGQFPGWTRARVDAKLNIDAATFNAEAYRENESTELAARGLYGEYALFFPATMLRASSQDGLDLRKLDDVRLRVDFVSVAR